MAKNIFSRLFKKSKPRRPSVLMQRLDDIDMGIQEIQLTLLQQQKQAAQPPTLARVEQQPDDTTSEFESFEPFASETEGAE